jgi:hypothetical protein
VDLEEVPVEIIMVAEGFMEAVDLVQTTVELAEREPMVL